MNLENNDNNNIENTELFKELKKGKTNIDIILYNSIIDEEQLSCGIDDLINIYEKIFDFACTLAGFQFVGIVFDKESLSGATDLVKSAYFFLGLGFVFSLFGALILFLSSQYLRSIRYEKKEFIIVSLRKYKPIFYMGYITLFINSTCFLLPVNVEYDLLQGYFAAVIYSFLTLVNINVLF